MILVDANILLYAYNTASKHHPKAKDWLQKSLSEGNPVHFAWTTILAFIRIATNIHAFPSPLTPEEATAIVSEWFACPNADILDSGETYWKIFSDLLSSSQARGPLVMDAHLAALAIENGATICTHDEDFTRFHGVKVFDPCA